MAQSKKILVSRNQEAIDKFTTSLDIMLPLVSKIPVEFSKLNTGKIKNSRELYEAYENTIPFYERKRLGAFEVPEMLLDLGVNKAKLDKMRDMPSTDSFYWVVENAKKLMVNQHCSIRNFEIDNNGQVVIDQGLVEACIEVNTVYAETKQELKLYNALTKVASALNEVVTTYKEITGYSPFTTNFGFPHGKTIAQGNYCELENEILDAGTHHPSESVFVNAVHPNFSLIEKSKQKINHKPV